MIEIIVPVYNAEDNIEQLFGSLIAQTKQHSFIVSFVDDCSTDNSVQLIEEWIDKVSFPCRILHTEKNMHSPGLTRQVALDNPISRAEYVMFLDSDDELLPNAIKDLSEAIMTNNCPFVSSQIFMETNDEYTILDLEDNLTWLHGKIYSRNFLEKYNIRFFEGMNEDAGFNQTCKFYWELECIKGERVEENCGIRERTYFWRNYKKSATRSDDYFIQSITKDIVNNYTLTYKRILNYLNMTGDLSNKKVEVKIYNHIVYHLSLFYELINKLYFINKPEEEIREVYSKIIKYCQDTKLYDLEWIDDYKKSFVKRPLDLNFTYISLVDFLKKIGIKVDLRPKMLVQRLEENNENYIN